MIRFILVALFVILFLLLGVPVLCVEYFLHKKNPKASELRQLRQVQWAFRVILFLAGTKITVIGEENVPKDQAVLYIGNHRSYFDIVMTYARCPGLTGYVAKNNMLKVPLLSTWMKRLHCLFINREDVKEGLKTILEGISMIKSGISMCIFPEGTRSTSPTEVEMLPFKEGSLKMAEKSGCLIVPMAITGSSNILEDHIPFIRSTEVIIEYGTPINITTLEKEDKRHLGSYSQKQILSMLNEHKKQLQQ